MPVPNQPAKADKPMTLDLAAMRNANAKNNNVKAAAPTRANPVQAPNPQATESASAADSTDFSEPKGPWDASKPVQAPPPAATSAPAPVAPSSAAVAQASSAAPASGTSIAASPPASSQLAHAYPITNNGTSNSTGPADPKCFTNAEGIRICYNEQVQSHNATDVHKEGGVNDFHHELSNQSKEAIQGKVPGKNVTQTLDNLGANSPPNAKQDGSTAFQGKVDFNMDNKHDIHKDNATYTDHETDDANIDSDWKSSYKGADGSKSMSDIDYDAEYKNADDTKIDASGKDKLNSGEWKESNDHRFKADNPGTKNDGALTWDEDKTGKTQKQEFWGKGVYDLHEVNDETSSVKASVDGDQGWKAFDQSMDDFEDVFFQEGGAAWKEKVKDPSQIGAAQQFQKRDVAGEAPGLTSEQLEQIGALNTVSALEAEMARERVAHVAHAVEVVGASHDGSVTDKPAKAIRIINRNDGVKPGLWTSPCLSSAPGPCMLASQERMLAPPKNATLVGEDSATSTSAMPAFCLLAFIAIILVLVVRSTNQCFARRQQRLARKAYMVELEGGHLFSSDKIEQK